MGFLKDSLVGQIAAVLDEAPASSPPQGRWHGVWEKARRLVRRQQAAPEPEALLQQKLADLHSAIFTSIDAEVHKS